MADTLQHNEWSGKTGGLPWMQRSLIAMFRVLPLWLLYGVMALVVPFYMIFNRKGYRAIYHFFNDRMGYNGWKSFWSVYANHFKFGQVILDRFGVYAGKKYHFTNEGQELMDELEKHPEGFILLSSHVGNYEIAGYSLKPKNKKFNALVYAGETATVMENRQRILSKNNGEIVSMPADRIFGSQKSVACDFFGTNANFPLGAFAMAVQKNVPVLAVFVMKEGMKRYHAYVQEVTCDKQASKREQMAQLVQSFAQRLETIVRRYPTQWFNYYDFWEQ